MEEATRRFVKARAMREIMSLALVSRMNVIMFGRGGHGKSEFTEAVLSAVDGLRIFVQFCGEGMDEARAYGGINLGALNDLNDPRIEYHPEDSFLASDVAVLEEGLDAPPSVLLSLKDTLTRRQMRNGRQKFDMQTMFLVCLTNHQPAEVAELGDAVAAFIERFPLQAQIEWDSYASGDYSEMFEAASNGNHKDFLVDVVEIVELQEAAGIVEIPTSVDKILAELIASAVEGGAFISPRTAMYARKLVAASAVINGRTVATQQDIVAIKYLPGCEDLAAEIEQQIEAAAQRADAQKQLEIVAGELANLKYEAEESERVIRLLQISQAADEVLDSLSQISVGNGQTEVRDSLRILAQELSNSAAKKAKDCTKK